MVFADLQGNFEAFFSRAAEFFRHLSEIEWTAFGIALLCLLGAALFWAAAGVLGGSINLGELQSRLTREDEAPPAPARPRTRPLQ